MNTASIQKRIAYAAFAVAIVAMLWTHSIPALLAGLLGFAITKGVHQKAQRISLSAGAELAAATAVGAVTLALVVVLIFGLSKLLSGESLSGLLLTLAGTLQQIRHYLPEDVGANWPDSVMALKELISSSLSAHAGAVAGFSEGMLHTLVFTLIGWVVGVLSSVKSPARSHAKSPTVFVAEWLGLWDRLNASFRAVALAQTKIAALNATLTAVFLLVICPLAGWHLPYSKTMVLVTFLCGLIPVVGNLVSNAMITLIALGVSLPTAIAALAFLVIVHKLEYFFSARIQGNHIGAQAWELLIVLFAFESLFGSAGMVIAPVLYAFAKGELKREAWLN
jgi:predicted PurR-regulated permease PerM